VSGNSFSGTLPSVIGNWQPLTDFWCYSNRFTGALPDTIGNWNFLQTFIIGSRLFSNENNFNSSLPSTIGSWFNLDVFIAYNSSLTGTIPESIQDWTKLTNFLISVNPIEGTLPAVLNEAWRLNNLQYFRVDSTELTGTIPYNSWTNIIEANFHDTNLVGAVPNNFCFNSKRENVTADCISEIECPIGCCMCF